MSKPTKPGRKPVSISDPNSPSSVSPATGAAYHDEYSDLEEWYIARRTSWPQPDAEFLPESHLSWASELNLVNKEGFIVQRWITHGYLIFLPRFSPRISILRGNLQFFAIFFRFFLNSSLLMLVMTLMMPRSFVRIFLRLLNLQVLANHQTRLFWESLNHPMIVIQQNLS